MKGLGETGLAPDANSPFDPRNSRLPIESSMNWAELLEQARDVAIAAHGEQRYGTLPYEHHLAKVVEVLKRFGASIDDPATAPLIVAGWLHDILEDTPIMREDLKTQFGPEVAELVWRVTDEPGASREDRKPATYRKTKDNELAVILKLADRIANVEEGIAAKSNKLGMYRREQGEFSGILRDATQHPMALAMWKHLDELLATPRRRG
jgi:guanosine-3',5'-bis(diphosphate) 3'-pyrophosphohydrolase